MSETEPRYQIKAIAQRTGLSTHVIRMWERRYGAVEPQRTDTNRRLYSDADVERLLLLKQAVDAGHAIGRIAHLKKADLEKLAAWRNKALAKPTPNPNAYGAPTDAEAFLDECKRAVTAMAPRALDAQLLQASAVLSQPALIEGLVVPLLHWAGDAWRRGELQVSHEHAMSAVVRHFLADLRRTNPADPSAPCIVVTTPPGQNHELGALLVSVIVTAAGWRDLYLGANSPVRDIAGAVRQADARAVALSIVYPLDDPFLAQELRTLHMVLPRDVPIIVGGSGARSYEPLLEEIGAWHLPDIPSLQRGIARLRTPGANDATSA